MTITGLRSPRAARAALSLVAVAALVAPLAAGAAPSAQSLCSTAGRVVQRRDWTTIRAPAFEAGPRRITDFAHFTLDSRLLYVTNGVELHLSRDLGCRWSRIFTVPAEPSAELPFSRDATKIVHVVGVAGRAPVLLLDESTAAGLHRPHVVTFDGGDAAASDEGLPPTGVPRFFEVASDGTTIYLGLDVGEVSAGPASSAPANLLYASIDRGRTWSLRSDPAQGLSQRGIAGLEIDPLDAARLWAWGPGGLFHSRDGGRTFAEEEEFAQSTFVGPVDVFHLPGAPARVVAFRPDDNDLLRSDDGGRRWLQFSAPPRPTSVDHTLAHSNFMLASGIGKVWAYNSASFQWFDVGAPSYDVIDISSDGTEDFIFFGRTDSTVEILATGDGGPPRLPRRDRGFEVPLIETPEFSSQAARLLGGRSRIRLDAGESATVSYRLTLPERRLPVDVFFLLDTTSSMQGLIAGSARSFVEIVNGLSREKIAAHFGLGEMRAYPDFFPPRTDEPNFVYRRVRNIGPPQTLQGAFEGMAAEGGGRFDSQLGALYQMATGAGQDLPPKDPAPGGHDVPPGLQADFRAKSTSTRIVIIATDEPFGRAAPDRDEVVDSGALESPEIPSVERVAAALNAKNIKFVAIGINAFEEARMLPDLHDMAARTGARAPAPGVDCNGDGIIDIPTGAPLVCSLVRQNLEEGENLASAIVNLVKAVPIRSSAELDVVGGSRVVAEVSPPSYPNVLLQTAKALSFDVTFRCTKALAGEETAVLLAARADGRDLDDARTTVVCAPPDENPIPPVPPVVAGPLLALIPLIPPAPPPLISQLGSATQAQTQAQAQAAMAAQEQEQPQLAYARAHRAELQEAISRSRDYEMSSLRRRGPELPTGALPLAVGAVALSFVFGVASTARARAGLVRVRRR